MGTSVWAQKTTCKHVTFKATIGSVGLGLVGLKCS